MSYKAEDKPLTVKAVKALLPVVLPHKWRNDPALLLAVKKGWIFPGKIVEDQLIEMSAGLLKANTNLYRSEDFNDYSDAKFISVSSWDRMYRATLDWEGLKNKKGRNNKDGRKIKMNGKIKMGIGLIRAYQNSKYMMIYFHHVMRE